MSQMESKKLQTTEDDRNPLWAKCPSLPRLQNDARIAHEQREVIRDLRAKLLRATTSRHAHLGCGCQNCLEDHASLAASAPFLED